MNNVCKKAKFLSKWIRGDIILDIGADVCNEEKTLHQYLIEKSGKKILTVDKFGSPNIQADLDIGVITLPKNYADTIIASEVVEHLLRPHDFLKECYRILKPNGRLIITTPNALSLGELQQYWKPNNHKREYREHVVNWHRINFDNLLKETDFYIDEFQYIQFHWKKNIFFRFLSWMIPILRPNLFYILRKKK